MATRILLKNWADIYANRGQKFEIVYLAGPGEIDAKNLARVADMRPGVEVQSHRVLARVVAIKILITKPVLLNIAVQSILVSGDTDFTLQHVFKTGEAGDFETSVGSVLDDIDRRVGEAIVGVTDEAEAVSESVLASLGNLGGSLEFLTKYLPILLIAGLIAYGGFLRNRIT